LEAVVKNGILRDVFLELVKKYIRLKFEVIGYYGMGCELKMSYTLQFDEDFRNLKNIFLNFYY